MITKIEEIKRLGAYAVNISFGEDIGCDYMDISTEKRNIRIMFTPVGCLGSRRRLWKGTYADLLKFDFKSETKIVSNPPTRDEISSPGFYEWGAE